MKGKGNISNKKDKEGTVEERIASLEDRVGLAAKAQLEIADLVAELQGNLNYVHAISEGESAVVAAVIEEGGLYHQRSEKLAKEAKDAGTQPDYRKLGPAAPHLFTAMIEALTQDTEDAMEGPEIEKHTSTVKELLTHLNGTRGQEIATTMASTFLRRKAYGTKQKFIMKLNATDVQKTAILYLLEHKAKFQVFIGKPPRSGVQRALQGTLG